MSSSHGGSITVSLMSSNQWEEMRANESEMLITNQGRHLSPKLKFTVTGLDPNRLYSVPLAFLRTDRFKYRYFKNTDEWKTEDVVGHDKPAVYYPKGGSIICGRDLMAAPIDFGCLKLTNNEGTALKENMVYLLSLRKYIPHLTIILKDGGEDVVVFEQSITLASFITVTAYQSPVMKFIKSNNNIHAVANRKAFAPPSMVLTRSESTPPSTMTSSTLKGTRKRPASTPIQHPSAPPQPIPQYSPPIDYRIQKTTVSQEYCSFPSTPYPAYPPSCSFATPGCSPIVSGPSHTVGYGNTPSNWPTVTDPCTPVNYSMMPQNYAYSLPSSSSFTPDLYNSYPTSYYDPSTISQYDNSCNFKPMHSSNHMSYGQSPPITPSPTSNHYYPTPSVQYNNDIRQDQSIIQPNLQYTNMPVNSPPVTVQSNDNIDFPLF